MCNILEDIRLKLLQQEWIVCRKYDPQLHSYYVPEDTVSLLHVAWNTEPVNII